METPSSKNSTMSYQIVFNFFSGVETLGSFYYYYIKGKLIENDKAFDKFSAKKSNRDFL